MHICIYIQYLWIICNAGESWGDSLELDCSQQHTRHTVCVLIIGWKKVSFGCVHVCLWVTHNVSADRLCPRCGEQISISVSTTHRAPGGAEASPGHESLPGFLPERGVARCNAHLSSITCRQMQCKWHFNKEARLGASGAHWQQSLTHCRTYEFDFGETSGWYSSFYGIPTYQCQGSKQVQKPSVGQIQRGFL